MGNDTDIGCGCYFGVLFGVLAALAFGAYWALRLAFGVDALAWFSSPTFTDEESAEISDLARDQCVEMLGPRHADLEARLDELEGADGELRARIEHLEADRDALEFRVDVLEGDVADLEARRRW
jgi:uncharacterized protein YceH (UPF0502 family)